MRHVHTPNGTQLGSNAATVRTQDAGGLFDTKSFNITVNETNHAPTITSSAITSATEDAAYAYDVEASDPNAGDSLAYSLDSAPAGMTIVSGSGLIQWTPDNDDVGNNAVTVRVTDTGGLYDTQSFNLNVDAAATGPKFHHDVVSGVGSSWTTVNLPNSYNSMVVVASPAYTNSSQPAVVRIREIPGTDDAFEMRVDVPGGGSVSGVDVH